MGKKLISFAMMLALAPGLGGCLVHTRDTGRHSHGARRPTCHPSQYWDGHHCRHKGRGHGARKHDGR